MAKKNDRFLALRFPEFRFLVGASFLFNTALMMQEVIIGYEMYKITGDPLAIGLIGLAQAAPFIGLSLIGGHFADILSKKKVIVASLLGIICCSLALHFAAKELSGGDGSLALQLIIYAVVFLTGTFLAFYSPTIQALRPFLVPRYAYENAATWGSATWQVGVIIGPGISGFIYNWVGFANTILVAVALMGVALLLWTGVKDRKIENPESGNAWLKIKEGLRFVKKKKMLLHSITLDLFSVLFGGVVAILPVFAEDVLHVGAQGLGILRAAPAVGAMFSLLIISNISLMKNAWRTLLLYVAGFGVATLVFALSKNFYLSVAALFLTGAFDAVSMVIRSTILQLIVPDEMRGRVSAVNGIFISASNELGAFESGLAASLVGAVPSVVLGGVASLAIVGFVFFKTKELLGVDLREEV
ncbi:MAG TPA: MFS transporter [Bacteroidetes bacterium]|nr:MFS transporter [Bacteroidota bacterium]